MVQTWIASSSVALGILLSCSMKGSRPFLRVSMYSAELIPPLLKVSNGPNLLALKQPQTIIEAFGPFSAGTKQSSQYFSLASLNTQIALASFPISTLHSSEKITFIHFDNGQSLCARHQSNLFCLFSSEIQGFLIAICF